LRESTAFPCGAAILQSAVAGEFLNFFSFDS
jgi:hypothetical protein